MKIFPRQTCAVGFLFMSTIVAQAQFTFTTNNGVITITGYNGSGVVMIPSTTNGFPVTGIGFSAFQSHGITSVTVPNSITNIGRLAFAGCTSLTNIILGNGITAISDQTFQGCTSLKNMTIPNGVADINQEAFEGTGLLRITIPDSVTNIVSYAFDNNASLTNITIGSGVSAIGNKAFDNYLGVNNTVSIYFKGNPPTLGGTLAAYAKVFYLPTATGWGTNFGGFAPTLWNPQAQTGDGNFGFKTNRFGFNITGTSNILIVIEASTNLAGTSWTALQSTSLTNGAFYFSDSPTTNSPRRFYRIRSP